MFRSAGARFLIVGLLALLMNIPMLMVGDVINDRANYSRSTIQSVGQEWGGEQLINGPVLVVPVQGPVSRLEKRETTDPATGTVRTETFEVIETKSKRPIYVLPTMYDATLETRAQERRRGIFLVPVYSADLEIDFDFSLTGLSGALEDGEEILWDRSFLNVSLRSNKALRGPATLTVDGDARPLEPSADQDGNRGGIRGFVGDPRAAGAYKLSLSFNGAGTVQIAPVGRTTNVTYKSDWPHPSFHGAYLPDDYTVSETGSEATWSIPHLARNLPQVSRADRTDAAERAAFGVRFFQPNDFYQKAYRAARYGILFIALTFLTVMLMEMRSEKRAHPVQYILIGLAQAIFVLLMVAYAEQIGFAYAYLLSAVATIGLLILYGFVGLKLGRRTWVLGLLLIVLYGLLYMILRSADYALLAGASLAFVALGGTMIATRNEDWGGGDTDSPPKPWFWQKQATVQPAPEQK